MADDEVKHYFQLEFGTNKDGHTELKLKGPEIPGTETSPTIVFHKKNGKFVFEIGVEIHEVDTNELADDFKSFFNEARRTDGRVGPLPVLMPPKKMFFRYDNTPKTYQNYRRDAAVFVGVAAKDQKTHYTNYPILPEPLYKALAGYYRTHDNYGNPLFL